MHYVHRDSCIPHLPNLYKIACATFYSIGLAFLPVTGKIAASRGGRGVLSLLVLGRDVSCDAPLDSAGRIDRHHLSVLLSVVPFGEGNFPLFIKTSFEI